MNDKNYDEIDPNDKEAWCEMGNSYYNKKNYDKAIECYEKAIEIDPNFENAWFNMGVLYRKKKQL